jgi:hypothetical protein
LNHQGTTKEPSGVPSLRDGTAFPQAEPPVDLSDSEKRNAREKRNAEGPPPCPFDAIVELYEEALPANPRVVALNGMRKAHIRARWRDVWEDERLDRDGLLDLFRRYFEKAARSKFLTGKTAGREGRKPFVASLDWLMRPTRFLDVIEGRYD